MQVHLNPPIHPAVTAMAVKVEVQRRGPAPTVLVLHRDGERFGIGQGSQSVDCYVTTAHTQMTCFSGEGTGRDHWWMLEVEDLFSPTTFGNTSYALPIISLFSSCDNNSTPNP